MSTTEVSGAARVRLEPSLGRVFLPGCRQCGAKHPLVHTPPLSDAGTCPDCGAPTTSAQVLPTVAAHLTNVPWHAAALLRLGRFFHDLSERLR